MSILRERISIANPSEGARFTVRVRVVVVRKTWAVTAPTGLATATCYAFFVCFIALVSMRFIILGFNAFHHTWLHFAHWLNLEI